MSSQETPAGSLRAAPFVVGCGRSGTTVLRSILDAHPELAVVHESRFITHFDRRRRYATSAGLDVDRFVDDLYDLAPGRSRVPTWGIEREDLRAHVRCADPRTLAEGVRAVFGAYATAQGKPSWGDKTPGYTGHVGRLAGLLPEAVFVHLIRDGRDVAASFLQVPFGPANVAEAALHWAGQVQTAREAGRTLPSSRYCEVRYEDLVAQPEREIRRVLEFAGLPFDSVTLRFFERSELSVGHGGQAHHANVHRPLQAGLRDWRRDLTVEQVATFESMAGGLLTELRYPRVTDARDAPLRRLRVRAAHTARTVGRRGRRVLQPVGTPTSSGPRR